MTIEMSVLTPHVPSICHEDQAPEFQKGLIEGMKTVSAKMYRLQPDVVVLLSCHWPSTFFHYVDSTPQHKGILTAIECPDLVTDVPYHYPGDEALGKELAKEGSEAGVPVVAFNDPTYIWDYGTVVPLRYLVPNGDIPIVNLSVTLAANLEETYKWGQQIGKVLRRSEKRVIFVASGALSHNLVRGRENMPSLSEQALNKQFVDYLMEENYTEAYEMLSQFSKIAGVEGGGRHLAMLFGILEGQHDVNYYAAAQSSGSWNPVMSFEPK